jgi:HAD superfamily hydrolase (TIGR01509 family)
MIFKKILTALMVLSVSVSAATQAVVFDWGNVIATENRSTVVEFFCETFHISEAEFERVNLEKRKAVQEGKTDVQFWQDFAKQQKIHLSPSWEQSYKSVLKASVGADPKMYALIDELKEKKLSVGLLSNINDRYTKLIRDFGFYDPFDPCLLSCEIGWEKPDPRAYQLLLDALQIPASDLMFIDDKWENVEGAKKLGIDAIQFQSAEQVRQELKTRGLF